MEKEVLKKRILEISKKHKLSHLSSCVSVLPILINLYSKPISNMKVVLDNAHSHLAHLVVKEALGIGDADKLVQEYGIHCDKKAGCDASGGSLGHGVGIAIGLALADPDSTVHCVVSDGSMMEGSNWEALRIATALNLKNLEIHANINGYTAVAEIDPMKLGSRLKSFYPGIQIHLTNNEEFKGVQGHYTVL